MEDFEIIVHERFFTDACCNMGYTPISAINELIDNSKDAKATEVEIGYDYQTKTLSIKDNGIGMSYQSLKKAMEFAPDKVRDVCGVGFYGVGLKTSLLNLANIDEGSNVEIITVHDEQVNKVIWQIKKGSVRTGRIEDVKNCKNCTNGTTISITNVILDYKTLENLYKSLGVVYYPSISKGDFNIYMNCSYKQEYQAPGKMSVQKFNNLKIEATNPLYFDKESFILSKDEFVATVNYKDTEYDIIVKAVLLNDITEETPIQWDIRKGADGGVKSLKRSGLYVIYGGRYIEVGDNFSLFGLPNQYFFSGIRVEFEIPKELTQLFGVKFNKTSGLKGMSNTPELEELVRKLRSKFNYFHRNFEHKSKRTKKEKMKEIKINNKRFTISEKGYGNSNIPWFVDYSGEKTIVTLNTDSNVYNNIILNSKNSPELKNMFKTCSAVLAATCEEMFQDEDDKKIEAYTRMGNNFNSLVK